MKYSELAPIYDGNEHFKNDGMPVNKLVSDFWRWNCSNLMNNTLRGALAEFIVATALDIDTETPRIDWDAFDLLYQGKYRLEIKSSAYIQSWRQKAESKVAFGIAPTLLWNDEQCCYNGSPERRSDIYIFCLFNHKERATADVTKLEQWDFYACPTHLLNEALGQQKTLSLNGLRSLGLRATGFDNLKRVIDELCLTLPERN